MIKTTLLGLTLAMVVTVGCSDESSGDPTVTLEDDTSTATDTADTTVEDTTVEDTTVEDTTVEDTTVEDTTVEDTTALPNCIDLAESTVDLPWAIPDAFTDTTPTWLPPDDGCPATALRTEPVPQLNYVFCNKGSTAASYRFEHLLDDEDLNAYLVVFAGAEIPTDATQCLAADEPFLGLAEVNVVVMPGQVLTVVATLADAAEGTFTLVAGPSE
ncbi:MAG: hypothetical protein ACI9MR_000818 [Myxococcota bacterium]|jgi:hypothetical protein